MTVIDTKPGIQFFQLSALEKACKLEVIGMRHSSGRSACAEARRRYGIRANRKTDVARRMRTIVEVMLFTVWCQSLVR